MKSVVVDLEMCRVSKCEKTREFRCTNEIIQIGAVLLDEELNIIDTFSEYVAPQYGSLTSKIIKLTGITHENLAGADYFEAVLKKFSEWLPDDVEAFVAWSETDGAQIRKELEAKGIVNYKVERLLGNYIDAQAIFTEKMSSDRAYKLSEALIAADIVTEGREHDGLVDAYNTALLYAKLINEPNLVLNPTYEEARKEEVNHLSYTFGSLFAGLDLSLLPA